jgi:hypothetical protein
LAAALALLISASVFGGEVESERAEAQATSLFFSPQLVDLVKDLGALGTFSGVNPAGTPTHAVPKATSPDSSATQKNGEGAPEKGTEKGAEKDAMNSLIPANLGEVLISPVELGEKNPRVGESDLGSGNASLNGGSSTLDSASGLMGNFSQLLTTVETVGTNAGLSGGGFGVAPTSGMLGANRVAATGGRAVDTKEKARAESNRSADKNKENTEPTKSSSDTFDSIASNAAFKVANLAAAQQAALRADKDKAAADKKDDKKDKADELKKVQNQFDELKQGLSHVPPYFFDTDYEKAANFLANAKDNLKDIKGMDNGFKDVLEKVFNWKDEGTGKTLGEMDRTVQPKRRDAYEEQLRKLAEQTPQFSLTTEDLGGASSNGKGTGTPNAAIPRAAVPMLKSHPEELSH